jgi:hypothetical protein
MSTVPVKIPEFTFTDAEYKDALEYAYLLALNQPLEKEWARREYLLLKIVVELKINGGHGRVSVQEYEKMAPKLPSAVNRFIGEFVTTWIKTWCKTAYRDPNGAWMLRSLPHLQLLFDMLHECCAPAYNKSLSTGK